MIGQLRTAGPAILGSLGTAVATQGFVLVTGILAARLLGPTDRGHLALVWTVTLMLTQLGTLGLPLAVTYEIAGARATANSLLRDIGGSVRRQIAWVTILHAIIVGGLVATTRTPVVAACLSIAVIPASFVQTFVIAALQGSQRFREYNWLRLVSVAVYAAVLTILAAVGAANLTTVTAAWVAGWLVAGMVTALAAKRVFIQDLASSMVAAASTKQLRRFGLRGLFGWVSPTETLRIDQLAVGLILSATSLGLYVAALAFTNLPRFLAQAVGNVAYPRVAAEPDSTLQRRLIWRYTALGTAIGSAVCGALAVAAAPLVHLAFGAAFAEAVGPMRILLFATALLCARRVLSEAMRGGGFVGATSRAELVSWLSLIPSLPIFGLTYGLNGVALVLCGAYSLSLGTLVWSMIGARYNGRRRPLCPIGSE